MLHHIPSSLRNGVTPMNRNTSKNEWPGLAGYLHTVLTTVIRSVYCHRINTSSLINRYNSVCYLKSFSLH